MGAGPWQQAKMIRDIRRAERARFKRAITKIERELHAKLAPGPICSRDILEACDALRAAASPRKE